MFASLFAAPWKLATGAAAIVALVIGFMLFLSYRDNTGLERQKQELVTRIEDPKTGYVARLAQANANVVTLRAAIKSTNEAMAKREIEAQTSRAELTRLRNQLILAQAKTRAMEIRLRQFLATKPQGGDLDARVRDIDARILKELAK